VSRARRCLKGGKKRKEGGRKGEETSGNEKDDVNVLLIFRTGVLEIRKGEKEEGRKKMRGR